LDALTRERLQLQLLGLRKVERKTIIFTTHDVDEAVFLADRIVVFSARPARVLKDIEVRAELPRDRTLEVMELPAFRKLRREVLGANRKGGDELGTQCAGSVARTGRASRRSGVLAGKSAIVTGGASGIGRAIAIALSEEGCSIFLIDRAPPAETRAVADTIA